jgi:hypothetical protein
MAGELIDLLPRLAVAGAVGAFVALVTLRPVVRASLSPPALLVQVVAAGVAVTMLLPATLLVFEQTRNFQARGLTEVGSAAFGEPPMSEAGARALKAALHPNETWASITRLGRCADVDLYLFYWLAFRLVPNSPDCADPDVEIYWKIAPPADADVIERGRDFTVVRP